MNLLTCLKMTNETIDETNGEWEECVVDKDYEIWNKYPYSIRRKGKDRIITESIDDDGYVHCTLNRKRLFKHRIVAQQWLENDEPETKRFIDHKNRNRTDNRLINLRWVSASENNMNKTASRSGVFEYVDEIPNDSIEVLDYGEHEFEDLYYYDNCFYWFSGINYRKLHICYNKTGYALVHVRDVECKLVQIYYSKFKRMYDLL